MTFHTPILFLIYRNPAVTALTFARIREMRPSVLYISADGPRNQTEVTECKKTREMTHDIDWDCVVQRRYSSDNMGCKEACASAISWFFEKEDAGIILEYDCLPDMTFFTFCQNMLETYKDDEHVFHIRGDNWQDNINRGDASYYFSAIPGIWGWATWRRAWLKYDPSAKSFGAFESTSQIKTLFTARFSQRFWLRRFHAVNSGENTSTWDIPWAFSVMSNRGLCIAPNMNLVSNIGFGPTATHTFDTSSFLSAAPTTSMGEIVHPATKRLDHRADNYEIWKHYVITDHLKVRLKRVFFRFVHLFLRPRTTASS